MSGDHNMYGDGTVYRGERSKDSETPTLDVQSTMEMWKRAYESKCFELESAELEVKRLRTSVEHTYYIWKRAYERVCEERDDIVKDADKAYELLRWAETEMRYARWGTRINDQHGRTDVYEAIVKFLK